MNGQWFFTTREGEQGPYRTRETALKEVARYVQERKAFERFQNQREETAGRPKLRDLALVPKGDDLDLTLDDLIAAETRR
jgi:hypothetical protein